MKDYSCLLGFIFGKDSSCGARHKASEQWQRNKPMKQLDSICDTHIFPCWVIAWVCCEPRVTIGKQDQAPTIHFTAFKQVVPIWHTSSDAQIALWWQSSEHLPRSDSMLLVSANGHHSWCSAQMPASYASICASISTVWRHCIRLTVCACTAKLEALQHLKPCCDRKSKTWHLLSWRGSSWPWWVYCISLQTQLANKTGETWVHQLFINHVSYQCYCTK